MRYILILLVWSIPGHLLSQALQNINYSYLYNEQAPFLLDMKPVRQANEWLVYFRMELSAQAGQLNNYVIQWEKRNSLSDKEGTLLQSDTLAKSNIQSGQYYSSISLPPDPVRFFLCARVVDVEGKRAWLYYETLAPDYPVSGGVHLSQHQVMFDPYLKQGTSIYFKDFERNVVVSHYKDNFPAGAPAFSEAMARVSTTIAVDTMYVLSSTDTFSCTQEGLYLVQQDTASNRGVAFRVHQDYPKYTTIENLVDPLVYITTKQEFDRLRNANGEKRAFDRVILSITGDTDRAKVLMRSYFNRVEMANKLFTSYKEGWKTDRGMIYIIFGPPENVYKFADREVWGYDNPVYKLTFNFVRSGSLFDPDNFVLVRDKKYKETWYEVVDLWRNARF